MTFWVGNEIFFLAIHDRCLILEKIERDNYFVFAIFLKTHVITLI